jgi:hypothetical protein
VKDIEPILVEERIPDGWESRVLAPYGLTLTTFNSSTVMPLERSIDENKYRATLAPESKVAEPTTTPEVDAQATSSS